MTKRITHHLPDATLAEYSAGTLPEAFALVVASHISLCDTCRAALAALDAVGGAVLDSADAPMLDDGALGAVFAMIDERDDAAPLPAPVAPDSSFPGPLAAYVGGGPDAVRWRRVGGGVKQAILPTARGATARLLYIPAGTAVPDHTHRGLELTLVLQGAFSDHVARFTRGDVETGDAALEHHPVAEPGEPCICLAATDAPLVFSGLLPRLAQPFLRI